MQIQDRILEVLPYQAPFRFVDVIHSVDDQTITGSYTFKKDEYFYKGHFVNHPVTPGVILTECMAQIALSCHMAYFLLQDDPLAKKDYTYFFSSSEVQFYKAVYPGEIVFVYGKKKYFRHGKFKSLVKMTNSNHETVCSGILTGMVFINE